MENRPDLARCLLDTLPLLYQKVVDLKALRAQLNAQNEVSKSWKRHLPRDGINSETLAAFAITSQASLALTPFSRALHVLSKVLADIFEILSVSTALNPTAKASATMENLTMEDLSTTIIELNAETGQTMTQLPEGPERVTTREIQAMKQSLAESQAKIDSVNEKVSVIHDKMKDMEKVLDGFKGCLAEMQAGIDTMNATMTKLLLLKEAVALDLNDAPQASDHLINTRALPDEVAHPANTSHGNIVLAAVCVETKSVLPAVLKLLPHAAPNAILFSANEEVGNHIPKLDRRYGCKFPSATIQVVNMDTIDAALALRLAGFDYRTTDTLPICILNLANDLRGGGGWWKGALAQEEALCYRTSLSFTLKIRYYPLPQLGAIYSPSVVVIRESLASGHKLLDLNRPAELPILSAISVAALRNPALTDSVPPKYLHVGDREIMKEKMRGVLRIAVSQRHRRLVLGALGCGAFGNPAGEVAACWAEVFGEDEFSVGWFERVVFAVLEDGRGARNFAVFQQVLGGLAL